MSIKVLVYAKRSNVGFDSVCAIKIAHKHVLYVNYVKSDFVVFFRQDKDRIGIH